MSKEHKALGHRPPPGSLAAQAQAAAARHPQGTGGRADSDVLTLAALSDADRIGQRGATGATQSVDLDNIGEAEARKLVSIEHRALGYNPPRGSLAAEAQRAAAKHPSAGGQLDDSTLTQAALNDAIDVEDRQQQVRGAGRGGSGSPGVEMNVGLAEEIFSGP
ncbi:hypothetical protein BV22DRAFT_1066942 [Leucogyrophana mollusca]|uniref:Uncharacterized protein n=1 Tax=Leucogyrophana mollusca TaxID=85980 RepID=A0ACB8BER8_9AGAM|nr:hypothetical protein BV22DRAFT_1066942 [Leucogyrophana mollusca]